MLAHIFQHTCRRVKWFYVAAAVAILCQEHLDAAESGLPIHIREALETNAEELSPITVSWTQQFQTDLTPQAAVARLQWRREPGLFFFKASHRLSWQDGKAYAAHTTPQTVDGTVIGMEQQASFDGDALYFGSTNPDARVLFKRSINDVLENDPSQYHIHSDYLRVAGYHIPNQVAELHGGFLTSELEYLLAQSGEFESVDNATIDGRRLIRISILSANPVRHRAEKIDLEQVKEEQRFTKDSPERKREILHKLIREKELPPKRRFAFYLDPAMNYAVRRWEQFYEPNTLLQRCDCSEFAQLSGRQVWLPKRCEIEYHEFHTLPGTFFKESFVTQSFAVSQMSGDPIPADRFVLNYTEPGAKINDATLPESASADDGVVRYTVPARAEDLDRVIAEARARAASEGPGFGLSGSRWVFVAFTIFVVGFLSYLWWRR